MKVQNPLTGRSSGSFAGAIFSTWKGKNVARSKPLEVKPSNTLEQIKNRNRLKYTAKGAAACRPVILKTFRDEAVGKTEYNVFVQKNLSLIDIDGSDGVYAGWAEMPIVSSNTLDIPGLTITDIAKLGNDITVTFSRALTTVEAASLELFVVGLNGTGTEVASIQVPVTAANTATVTAPDGNAFDTFRGVFYSPASGESFQSVEI